MSKEKLGQGPAFPFEDIQQRGDGSPSKWRSYLGMSKRLYLASMAMQGLLARNGISSSTKEVKKNNTAISVRDAYDVADELLKQENK